MPSKRTTSTGVRGGTGWSSWRDLCMARLAHSIHVLPASVQARHT